MACIQPALHPTQMKDKADRILSVALEIVGEYPKVAGL
jgi:hypothetical protein